MNTSVAKVLNCNHAIPCTRHDESGDRNLRIRETLAYAFGKAGPCQWAESIVSAHDHKGRLAMEWENYTDMVSGAPHINAAWADYANECWVEHFLASDDVTRSNAETNGERRG